MQKTLLTTCALGAMLLLGGFAKSGEDKDLRATIDKAIAVQGGEALLAKFDGQTLKGAGKFHALGDPVDFTIEITSQKANKLRVDMEMQVMNFDLKIKVVANGEKGWLKINDEVQELPADELTEQKEQMHCHSVVRLLPLKDKSYKLATLGDVKIVPTCEVSINRDELGGDYLQAGPLESTNYLAHQAALDGVRLEQD